MAVLVPLGRQTGATPLDTTSAGLSEVCKYLQRVVEILNKMSEAVDFQPGKLQSLASPTPQRSSAF